MDRSEFIAYASNNYGRIPILARARKIRKKEKERLVAARLKGSHTFAAVFFVAVVVFRVVTKGVSSPA